MQPEVVDLSSDEEEVVLPPVHQSTSSTVCHNLTNDRNLQRVNNMKAHIALNFNAHQEKYHQPNVVIHIYVEQ